MTTEPITTETLDAVDRALDTAQIMGCSACGGDCSSANPPMTWCPMHCYRDALALLRKERST